MLDYFNHKLKSLEVLSMPYEYGFIVGHSYLTNSQVVQIKNVLESSETQWVKDEYEKRFSALIGNGYGISFAAGRMAFYILMKALGIGKGDEVILPGFTCSVMVNAIFRTGATPIFVDIDANTFGSNAKEIENKISPRTKLIVAQHSFGIPCKIEEIVDLGKKMGIFVVEDSAITLDSSVKGVKVGNWGGAAIFSTEHSKPLNTIIGGFLYTKDKVLYKRVYEMSVSLTELDKHHQFRLYKQFLIECKYYFPAKYKRSFFINFRQAFLKKLRSGNNPVIYFGDDYSKITSEPQSYPYPAKLPSFLAQIGLFELERWHKEKERRKKILEQYIDIMLASKSKPLVPMVYKNQELEIVPFRFVFTNPEADKMRKIMSKYIDVNSMLFCAPIVCCPDGLESLGYSFGSCRTSEKVSSEIINWPCIVPETHHAKLLEIFKQVVNC